MNLSKKAVLGGGAGAVALALAIYGGTVFAQSSASPQPSPSASPPAAAAAGYQNFIQHLASRLNISTSQADSAVKGAETDAVADAVKAGRITQQQADRINQRIQSGSFPFGLGPGAGRRGPGGPGRGMMGVGLNVAAGALNMQPSDLQAQLRSGKSLRDVAAAQKVDFSKVQSAVASAVKNQLDPLVSSGRITQQQEQRALDRINSSQFGTGHFGHGWGNGGSPAASPQRSASASA